MARINIEADLFTRNAWLNFVIKKGSPEAALGALVFAFIQAQKFWAPNEELIPHEVWESEGLDDLLIESGLAEKRETGIYVKGSKEQFAWLMQKHEAGKKGGRPKKKTEENRPVISDKRNEPNGTRVEPSSSISISSSISNSNSFSSSSSSDLGSTLTSASPPEAKKAPTVIPEFKKHDEVAQLLGNVSEASQKRWLSIFNGQAEFVVKEMLKAADWLDRNPARRPRTSRGYAQFCSSWLNRAWPNYQKSIPTNSVARPKTFAQQRSDNNRELWRKVEAGEL